MSSEFENQLKASMERELSPAYLADDNPRLARYQALAASGSGVKGAGGWLAAAGPAARLRLAAVVAVGAAVISGAAVVDASRSSQGLILPLLQRVSGHYVTEGAPSTATPANAVVQQSHRALTTGSDDNQASQASPVGTRNHDHGDDDAPALTAPSPSPEQEGGASPGAGEKTEAAPKPGCSPQPPTPGGAVPNAPPVTDGRSTDHGAPQSGRPSPSDRCG